MSNVWGKGNMYGAREVWVVGHTLIFLKKDNLTSFNKV